MNFGKTAVICDRCSQLCWNPVTFDVEFAGKTIPAVVCNDCFEAAVRRSGAHIVEFVDGHLDVLFPDRTTVRSDL